MEDLGLTEMCTPQLSSNKRAVEWARQLEHSSSKQLSQLYKIAASTLCFIGCCLGYVCLKELKCFVATTLY